MNICLFSKEEISLPLPARDERAVHIKKILHKKAGDTFAAGIIDGEAGIATITNDDGDIYFSFEPYSDKMLAAGKPLFDLQMIIGFPRPIQLKRLLRDMAALGVRAVHLAGTELGEKSYLKADLSKPEEIRKMLIDGTVQAGGTHVPKNYIYPTLEECLNAVNVAAVQEPHRPLLVALDNVRPQSNLTQFLQENPPQGNPVIAAIGSERGWSENERALLEERGFVRLGMGSRIMRTETATTVAASIILSAMGKLE